MQHKGLSRENKDLTEARALCRAAGSCESKLVKASYAPKAAKKRIRFNATACASGSSKPELASITKELFAT